MSHIGTSQRLGVFVRLCLLQFCCTVENVASSRTTSSRGTYYVKHPVDLYAPLLYSQLDKYLFVPICVTVFFWKLFRYASRVAQLNGEINGYTRSKSTARNREKRARCEFLFENRGLLFFALIRPSPSLLFLRDCWGVGWGEVGHGKGGNEGSLRVPENQFWGRTLHIADRTHRSSYAASVNPRVRIWITMI